MNLLNCYRIVTFAQIAALLLVCFGVLYFSGLALVFMFLFISSYISKDLGLGVIILAPILWVGISYLLFYVISKALLIGNKVVEKENASAEEYKNYKRRIFLQNVIPVLGVLCLMSLGSRDIISIYDRNWAGVSIGGSVFLIIIGLRVLYNLYLRRRRNESP